MECIQQPSLAALYHSFGKMREFQLTHNGLIHAIQDLRTLTADPCNHAAAQFLVRACYKEFFSLVEADLYLINQFNPYPGYTDKDTLISKFKKTYRHHAQTFKKNGLHQIYQSSSFRSFLLLKEKRDGFTHPKGRSSLLITPTDLHLFDKVFLAYNDHINSLMTDVGVSAEMPLLLEK